VPGAFSRVGTDETLAEAMAALDPEQRLVASVLRQALADMRDSRQPAAVRAQAAAFLAGTGATFRGSAPDRLRVALARQLQPPGRRHPRSGP